MRDLSDHRNHAVGVVAIVEILIGPDRGAEYKDRYPPDFSHLEQPLKLGSGSAPRFLLSVVMAPVMTRNGPGRGRPGPSCPRERSGAGASPNHGRLLPFVADRLSSFVHLVSRPVPHTLPPRCSSTGGGHKKASVEEAPVQHYRAFRLDLTGDVISQIDLVCSNDNEATSKAQRLVKDHDIEVWRLDRRVAILRGRPRG
jgi:hypothetical protein